MFGKILTTVWLCAGMIGAAAAGDDRPGQDNLQMRAKRSYVWSLSSEHASIRNSAIFRVMQYRAAFPQDDMQPFVKALREMSVSDASPQNRLYAFIACTFLENNGLLKTAGEPPEGEEEKEAYFMRLQEILRSTAAVARE